MPYLQQVEGAVGTTVQSVRQTKTTDRQSPADSRTELKLKTNCDPSNPSQANSFPTSRREAANIYLYIEWSHL